MDRPHSSEDARPAPADVSAQQSDDGALVADITAIVREADANFQRVGGSSRHWVRDCFMPLLNQRGLFVSAVHQDVGESVATAPAALPTSARWYPCRAEVQADGLVLIVDVNGVTFATAATEFGALIAELLNAHAQPTPLPALTAELLAALKRAKSTIRDFEAMGMPEQAAAHSWELYQHSPEMKAINAAIARADAFTGGT